MRGKYTLSGVQYFAFFSLLQFDAFLDEEVDEKVKFSQRVISEVRSAKAKYDIPNKTKVEGKTGIPRFRPFVLNYSGILNIY